MTPLTASPLQVIVLLAALLIVVASVAVVLVNLSSGDPNDLDLRAESHRPKSQFPK